MKKPKIAMPPTPLNNPAMLEAINKGGSVKADLPASEASPQEDKLKSFTFKIYESELAQIRDIQDQLPKRDRISIHDFVVAALKDKIAKERKRLGE
ncbi:hypothetical protein [Fibrella forsythiae]|uniref:Uncharacterized protein n=1 Tax=Fibrella forsythiae TaxID=2817061 RepID=A0ABS3JT83_9BACT|nr:hypothetical protein [Fibrella forsythiae]MBO0953216.1 hypothetical protein [Fibrella forsythiae]